MQAILHVPALPPAPAEAAAEFHTQWVPQARAALADGSEDNALLIVMPEADHTHGEWRLAAVRMLARLAAPARVNLIGCDAADDIARFAKYLERAPGVTGQYLPTNAQLAIRPPEHAA